MELISETTRGELRLGEFMRGDDMGTDVVLRVGVSTPYLGELNGPARFGDALPLDT